MPNHISNKLTLLCDEETAARVFAAIAGRSSDDKPLLIDFNTLIPYPQRYADLDKAAREWEQIHGVAAWQGRPKDGYSQGGYQWCIDNWSTKWNAYDQKKLSDHAIYFETAWSPPLRVFEALTGRFPDVTFLVEFADEDIGNHAGRLRYHDGCVGKALFEGTDAARLWFELNPDASPTEHGYDPETFERVDEGE